MTTSTDAATDAATDAGTDAGTDATPSATTDGGDAAVTTQVYAVYIRATPQRIWDAITDPAWNGRYGYGAPATYDLRPGGRYESRAGEAMKKAGDEMGVSTPDVVVDGEVLESVPPRRLVQTWRMLMDPDIAAEGFTRLTYEITELPDGSGVSKLVVTHDLTGAPKLAHLVAGNAESQGAGGGWNWVLDDLKTLLETGSGFQG